MVIARADNAYNILNIVRNVNYYLKKKNYFSLFYILYGFVVCT